MEQEWGAMTRRGSDDWSWEPAVKCWYDIARLPLGIRDTGVGQMNALLHHPAVWARLERGLSASEALAELVGSLPLEVRRSQAMSARECDAFAVLVGGRKSLTIDGVRMPLRNYRERGDAAARLLYGPGKDPAATLRHSRRVRRADGTLTPRSSPEIRLYEAVMRALDDLDLPPSASAHIGRTPAAGGHTGECDDLIGTWLGVSESQWNTKDPEVRDGTVPCFMVIRREPPELTIDWLYRGGRSRSIAVRIVDVPPRRIICVYEADLTYDGALPRFPAHRGTCLLEIRGTPAARISGPYWSDRRLTGGLTFTKRSRHLASTLDEAVRLFSAPSV